MNISPHKDFIIMTLATVGLYLALGVLGIVGYIANSHRISDIQQSRLVSCQRTYEGIREVFSPFFLPANKETPKQAENRHKFNTTINRLKEGCSHQTKTHSN
jgi:hypothetical protein